ncbi:MAG TPA: branched-chain amino acid ABC transporter permease, partial [Jatrophihabitans sp.]
MTYLQVLLNGVLLGGFYLITAQGLNLIFGVMGVVNLAHGAFMVLGGLGVYSLYDVGVNPFAALPIVMIAAAAAGVLVQYLLIERIKARGRQGELLGLLATFGLSYVCINIGQQVWGSDFRTIPYLQSSVNIGSLRFPIALLIGVGLSAALTTAVALWLTRTTAGKSLLATAQSPVGAGLCGINPRRLRLVGFGIGTALAAAAGMLLVLTQPVAPQLSTNFTIIAFVVVALGGIGNYSGAALGAVLVGVIQTLSGYQFGSV